ncbi:hypothetical protein [Streptomyces sp. GZWMJZ-114]|uniref:hypothetical protein n=1 Tax=Streptomyces sp. GZWMJZ-114 TaxID=2494734 RepID=UPI001F5144B3|nr:hypothetical protein [Streptomyces sp. GZWMJZ-114]
MAELMLFRQEADGRDVELSGSTVALEVELQRRVEAGLEQRLGIRFLASEYATGPWHRGRIDTLGLDENGSPVVIEFKKGSDSGVLSQAVSYMAGLESAQHESRRSSGKCWAQRRLSRSTGDVRGWSVSRPASRTMTGWPCSGCRSGSIWCATAPSRSVC